jgi:hypothetical protein
MREIDELVQAVLLSVHPRRGFETGLHATLVASDPSWVLEDVRHAHVVSRWRVAGAVAGLATASGALYFGRKRYRGAA